jgi:hypothetical protein
VPVPASTRTTNAAEVTGATAWSLALRSKSEATFIATRVNARTKIVIPRAGSRPPELRGW